MFAAVFLLAELFCLHLSLVLVAIFIKAMMAHATCSDSEDYDTEVHEQPPPRKKLMGAAKYKTDSWKEFPFIRSVPENPYR